MSCCRRHVYDCDAQIVKQDCRLGSVEEAGFYSFLTGCSCIVIVVNAQEDAYMTIE